MCHLCVLPSEPVDVKCASGYSSPTARVSCVRYLCVPARSRTEPPSFGGSSPQIRRNGDEQPPCQESNLDNRLRRPLLGIHRVREISSVPSGIRTRVLGSRDRSPKPLDDGDET